MFCHKCGSAAVEGATFCQRCGTKLLSEEIESAQMEATIVNDNASRQMTDEISGGEKTATEYFDVMLIDAGENKIKVIKAVRELTDLGLKEAKELVENIPAELKRSVTREDAELIKGMMTKAGATVECTADALPPDGIADQEGESSNQMQADGPPLEKGLHAKNETSEFQEWWSNCSKTKKIFVGLGALLVGGIVLYAIIAFLREFGYLLLGIAVVGGVIFTLVTGSKEEKTEMRKTVIQMVVWIVVIGLVACVIVLKPDFISNIFQPGAGVRNAYLSQYSESVTIEEAFENFFDNGKWSTHKIDEYSYVLFDGSCDYLGERADVRVRFKITGEHFVVDSVDINGQIQNDLVLYSLLSAIYDNSEIQ